MSTSCFAVHLTLAVTLVLVSGEARAQVLGPVPPADSARLAAARELLAASGAVDVMLNVIKANLPAAQQASPQLPPQFWTRFRDTIALAAPALVDSVAAVYARTFTLQDLQQLAAFYETPVGQRFRDLQPKIVAESAAIGQRWGARIGAAIGASLGKN